jgi:hypothetical protein
VGGINTETNLHTEVFRYDQGIILATYSQMTFEKKSSFNILEFSCKFDTVLKLEKLEIEE